MTDDSQYNPEFTPFYKDYSLSVDKHVTLYERGPSSHPSQTQFSKIWTYVVIPDDHRYYDIGSLISLQICVTFSITVEWSLVTSQ